MRTPTTTIATAAGGAALTALLALGAGLPAGAAPTPAPSASGTAAPLPSATPTPTVRPSAAPTPAPVPVAPPVVPPVPPVVPPVTKPAPTSTPTPTPTPVVPAPTALRLNRTRGHSAYSRSVVLTGTNLLNLAAVRVGTTPVTGLTVLSPTTARFVLPNAIDFQARVATVYLTARADRITRPTPVTFTFVVANRVDRQMAYAFQNWNRQTSARFGFLAGNDCANFTSQVLLARGWKQSSAWFNSGAGRWSGTWVSSTALSTWLKKRPDLVTRVTYSGRDAVKIGDVVQFRWTGHPKGYTSWDHTAVVSKVVVLPNGHHDLYYVAHTNARQYGGGVDALVRGGAEVQFFHVLH